MLIIFSPVFTNAVTSSDGDWSTPLDPRADPDVFLRPIPRYPEPDPNNFGLPPSAFELTNSPGRTTFLDFLLEESSASSSPLASGSSMTPRFNITPAIPNTPSTSSVLPSSHSAHYSTHPVNLPQTSFLPAPPTLRIPPSASRSRSTPNSSVRPTVAESSAAAVQPQNIRAQQSDEPRIDYWDLVGMTMSEYIALRHKETEPSPVFLNRAIKHEKLLQFLQALGFNPLADDSDKKRNLPGPLPGTQASMTNVLRSLSYSRYTFYRWQEFRRWCRAIAARTWESRDLGMYQIHL